MKFIFPLIISASFFFANPSYAVPSPPDADLQLSAVEKEQFGAYHLAITGICRADVLIMTTLEDEPHIYVWFEHSARKWRKKLEANAVLAVVGIKPCD